MHWFDRPRFWREARRLLAPGGVVAVWTYDLFRCTPEVDRVVRTLYDEVVGEYWTPQRDLVNAAYGPLERPFEAAFERIPAPSFGMSDTWDLARVRGYLRTWSASKRWSEAHGGADPLARVDDDLAVAWGPAATARRLRWTITVLAGR